MALQWVKTNAGSFGGQPHNITLMGESAGAASIDFHVRARSPASTGLHKDDDLFHQVILQSGSAFCPWAAADSNTPRRRQHAGDGVGLLCEALDCNSLAELRGIDCRNLVKAAVKINGPAGHNFFLPTPDDSVFFPAVLTAAAPPSAADSGEDQAAGTAAAAKLGCAATTSLLPTLQGINEREGAFLTAAFLASLLGRKRRPTLDVDDMLGTIHILRKHL
jgi:carboxylesterase type B